VSGGTDKEKKKDNQQRCDSIQQNYNRTANDNTAKLDTRFWVSVGAEPVAGG